MDLQPLLQTLSKTTHGRILAFATQRQDGTLTVANVPILGRNPGDPNDRALVRFVKAWFHDQAPHLQVEVQVDPAAGLAYTDDDGKQTPLMAILAISFWEKREMPSMGLDPAPGSEEPRGEKRTTRSWGSKGSWGRPPRLP